ncbi:MAG: exo-beta-N-acetylmuramidase NamZ domain-containing protein [Desulfomonilaceae bacterium]
MVVTGLAKLVYDPSIVSEYERVGLLYNQASIDTVFRESADVLFEILQKRLTTLFGPQHGVGATEQDNMIETDHALHRRLGLPIYSLYSSTRRPTPEMLQNVDAILVDIQDVGTRVYTFCATVCFLMEVCAGVGKAVIILDRPNPINGVDVEGSVLEPEFASFVGPYPLPMRHGMTVGELMNYYNQRFGIKCDLKVIRMDGWDRNAYFDQTGLQWAFPSPNMPTIETAVVYPGQVMLEGTNLSEGRGTARPFEIFGAPFINPEKILANIEKKALYGATLRIVEFKPVFNKWMNKRCLGFQMHVTDRNLFRPYRATLAILSSIIRNNVEFKWSNPPYEYVFDKAPIDVILGDGSTRKSLERNDSVFTIEENCEENLNGFLKIRKDFLLY